MNMFDIRKAISKMKTELVCTKMIKKAIPKAFSKKCNVFNQINMINFDKRVDGIEGDGLHPLRVNLLSINRNINIAGN